MNKSSKKSKLNALNLHSLNKPAMHAIKGGMKPERIQ